MGSKVVVNVRGLRNDRGVALVALFDEAEGFPTRPERAKHHGAASIVGGASDVVFEDVASGRWAAAVLHDEDVDFEMDRNAIGLPKEGLGLSRDREWRLGMPSFGHSAFEVRPGEDTGITIHPRYLLG